MVNIQLNLISVNPHGPLLFNIFVDNDTLSQPVSEFHETLDKTLHDIVSKYFSVDPNWILRDVTLSDAVFSEDNITLLYTCTVPKLSSINGHFVCITDYNRFKKSIQSLKGSNV